MYACEFPIGFPIGTLFALGPSSLTLWQQLNVVFSVGPYPLISLRPAQLSRYVLALSTITTSPPANIYFTPDRSSSLSLTMASNSAAVNHNIVTCSPLTTLPISSSDGGPAGIITSLPPFSSAPQISNVDTSKDAGEICNTTSSVPNRT